NRSTNKKNDAKAFLKFKGSTLTNSILNINSSADLGDVDFRSTLTDIFYFFITHYGYFVLALILLNVTLLTGYKIFYSSSLQSYIGLNYGQASIEETCSLADIQFIDSQHEDLYITTASHYNTLKDIQFKLM